MTRIRFRLDDATARDLVLRIALRVVRDEWLGPLEQSVRAHQPADAALQEWARITAIELANQCKSNARRA